MWKTLRIAVLLLVLIVVAGRTWLDRVQTQSWRNTLWVGIFPLNGDGSPAAERYIADLSPDDFSGIETFFPAPKPIDSGCRSTSPSTWGSTRRQGASAAARNGRRDAGVAWWSLKLRWFAAHAVNVPGRTPPRIRIFMLYHDPASLPTVPDSHGLQKGLMGVVHGFAMKEMTGSNNIVIAHELMHTLGATDKYDFGTGAPLYPSGFAEPDRNPRYPQPSAEIMAGRRALTATDFEMPPNLRSVIVGPATANEIRWTHH